MYHRWVKCHRPYHSMSLIILMIGNLSSAFTLHKSQSPKWELKRDLTSEGDPMIMQMPDEPVSGPTSDFSINKNHVYKQFILDVLASPRVSRRESDEDMIVVSKILLEPSFVTYFQIDEQSVTSAETNVTYSRKQMFMNQLRSQRDKYMNITGITTAQYKLALKALNYLGDTCAKRNSSLPLYVGWSKVRELGVILQENALSTYLYVLTTESSNEDWSYETDVILSEVATFHDLMYEPCEKTVTLRIKSYIDRGDVCKAELLLDTLPKVGGELRLRTCVPILELYCRRNGDMASALKLYKKMKASSTVLLEPEIFSMIISSLAIHGCFQPNATYIDSAFALGYSKGPELLDQLLTDMAEDVVEISNTAATEIRNGFVQGFKGLNIARNLERVPWDCQLYPVAHPASPDELIACRVTVDGKTGLCPRSQTRLKLMVLSEEDRRQMYNVLFNMAESQFNDYDAKLEAKNQNLKTDLPERDFARNELQKFASWLE